MEIQEKPINKNTMSDNQNIKYSTVNNNNNNIDPVAPIEQSPIPQESNLYAIYKEELEDNDGYDSSPDSQGTLSYKAGATQISNTIMGAGILSLPIVMRYLGIIPGTIFIILLAFETVYSVYLLIQCQKISGQSGYSMFAKITMGSFGSLLVKIIIIINNYGFCVAYFRIFGDMMQSTVQAFVSPDNYWVTNWRNYWYVIIITIIMSVFIFKKSMDSFKKVAMFGVFSISVFVISLCVLFFYKLIFSWFKNKITSNYLFPNCTTMEALQSLPTIFLAFGFQFNMFPIYFSLKNRTSSEMSKATKIGVSFCLLIFILTGYFGFLMYGTTMNDTVLTELYLDMVQYKDSDLFVKYIIIIINTSFISSTLMSFPVMFFSVKINFLNSLLFCKKRLMKHNKRIKEIEMQRKQGENVEISHSGEKKPSDEDEDKSGSSTPLKKDEYAIGETTKKVIIICLYLSMAVLTVLIPKLKIIFHIVGSTAGNFISFIFPNLFYIRLVKISKLKNDVILPYIWMVIGFCFWGISWWIAIIKND